MDNDTYRRMTGSNTSQSAPTSSSVSSRPQRHPSQSSGRHSNVQGLNFRTLKNVSLNCAKSLTNKLITLSHSGVSAASNAINSYKEGVAQRQAEAAKNPNTLKNIADRLSTSTENIVSHRELVAVIERMTTWSGPPMEVNLEKDRFGAPTRESISTLSIINTFLLEKTLLYIMGRRDCCVFIIKFVTWRMRNTKYPEEIILSLEILNNCVERMGPYFLSLLTKSCMRTLRRLIFMTTMRHSIASGMKKQITRLLGKTAYVHPGVSTDVRIHVFKSKTLYMVQLWYDVFLLDLASFPVFFDGYKDMRSRGIKFPTVDPSDKLRINMNMPMAIISSSSSSSANFLSSSGIRLPLTPEELDKLLAIVQKISVLEQGCEYDQCINYLKCTRDKILACINILSNEPGNVNQKLLERLLNLNDAMSAHLNASLSAGRILESYSNDISNRTPSPSKPADVNLLDLGSSDEEAEDDNNFSKNILKFDQDEEVDLHSFDFSLDKRADKGENDHNIDDVESFSLEWNSEKGADGTDTKKDYFNDLFPLIFSDKQISADESDNTDKHGDKVISSVETPPTSINEVPGDRFGDVLRSDIKGEENEEATAPTEGNKEEIAPEEKDNIREECQSLPQGSLGSSPLTEASARDEKTREDIKGMIDEFNKIDLDFGHISTTGF